MFSNLWSYATFIEIVEFILLLREHETTNVKLKLIITLKSGMKPETKLNLIEMPKSRRRKTPPKGKLDSRSYFLLNLFAYLQTEDREKVPEQSKLNHLEQ